MLKVLAALVVLSTAVYVIFFSPIFKIKSIDLGGQQNCLYQQEQLEKYHLIGKNLLTISSSNLSQNLRSDFSCIDQIKVEKSFPSTLKIEITTQEPIVKIEGSDLVINKNGIVSKTAQSKSLPTIFLPSGVQTDQKITDHATLFAIDIAAQLEKTDFVPQNVRIVEGGDVAVYNTQGTIALFSSAKSANAQVDSLQFALGRAKIEPTKISKIDLRFDKPVISAK